MLIQLPIKRRYRQKKRTNAAPPAGPVLVSAVYVAGSNVVLTFADAVTVTTDSMVAVQVFDAQRQNVFMGDDFVILSPTAIQVNLYPQGPFSGVGVTMTVTPPTGIEDAGDAVEWADVADVADVALPYSV